MQRVESISKIMEMVTAQSCQPMSQYLFKSVQYQY